MDYLTASLLSSTTDARTATSEEKNAWTQELDRTARCIKREENRTDEWLSDKPAYLRIYLDIPGQYERVKHTNPLAKVATREEARRKADRWIIEERNQRQGEN